MWALIIHLDSEGIDPQRWQSLDGWEGWRIAPTQTAVDARARFYI